MRYPLDNYWISQGFTPANNPTHKGIDLATIGGASGVQLKAPESGVITAVLGNWKAGGYFGGNYIKMKGDSGYSYYMGHCASVAVSVNQRVTEGQVIGIVGMTGQADGNHTHFEMYNSAGTAVDATKYLTKGGTTVANITKEEATVLKNVMRVLNSEAKGWDRASVHNGMNDYKEIAYLAGMGVNVVEAIARYSQQAWDEGKAYRATKDAWLAAFKEKPALQAKIADLEKQLAESKKAASAASLESESAKKLQAIKDALK